MPLPLAPITAIAIRYGTVALATYALASRVERGRRDQRAEDALDELTEGTTLRREPEQINATTRFHRVIRLGAGRPGIEVDFTSITRFRIRKVE